MGDADWCTTMGGLLSATRQASPTTAHTIKGNYLYINSFWCSDGCFTYVLQNRGHTNDYSKWCRFFSLKVTWQIQIIFSMAMAIGREVSWCNFGLSYLRRNVMTGRQVFLAEKSARLLLSPGGRVGKLTSLTMCCKCPIDSDCSTTG